MVAAVKVPSPTTTLFNCEAYQELTQVSSVLLSQLGVTPKLLLLAGLRAAFVIAQWAIVPGPRDLILPRL